jgi:hypothetical protein
MNVSRDLYSNPGQSARTFGRVWRMTGGMSGLNLYIISCLNDCGTNFRHVNRRERSFAGAQHAAYSGTHPLFSPSPRNMQSIRESYGGLCTVYLAGMANTQIWIVSFTGQDTAGVGGLVGQRAGGPRGKAVTQPLRALTASTRVVEAA